jgi:hypothetical protein
MLAVQNICDQFRAEHNGASVAFCIRVHVMEVRNVGSQSAGSFGHNLNDMYVKMAHLDWDENNTSAQLDKCVNGIFDCVRKRDFIGQPTAFFYSSIVVSAHHKVMVGEDPLLGMVRIGCADVYMMEGQNLPMQWFPLVNPDSEEPDVPLGWIRLGVSILAPNRRGKVDKLALLPELTRPEVLHNPRFSLTGKYLIKVKIYKAEDLPEAKSSGACWRLTSAAASFKSDTKYEANETYNILLQVPVLEPNCCDMIKVEQCTPGTLMSPEMTVVSTIYLSWKELLSNPQQFKNPHWHNLYEVPSQGWVSKKIGAPVGSIVNKVTDAAAPIVEKVPVVGAPTSDFLSSMKSDEGGSYQEKTKYCGRVLLAIEFEPCAVPSVGAINMKPKDCEFYTKRQPLWLHLKLFKAQNILTTMLTKTHVQVELCMGSFSAFSQAFAVADGSADIFSSFDLCTVFPYDESLAPFDFDPDNPGPILWFRSLPEVWIKVYRVDILQMSRSLLGFYHSDIFSLTAGCNSPIMMKLPIAPKNPKLLPWHNRRRMARYFADYTGIQFQVLQKDSSCVLREDEFAGHLCFALHAYTPYEVPRKADGQGCLDTTLDINNPYLLFKNVRMPPPPKETFELWGNFYQGRDFLSLNASGVSSTHIRLSIGNQSKTTVVVKETNNPVFDQRLRLSNYRGYILYSCDTLALGEIPSIASLPQVKNPDLAKDSYTPCFFNSSRWYVGSEAPRLVVNFGQKLDLESDEPRVIKFDLPDSQWPVDVTAVAPPPGAKKSKFPVASDMKEFTLAELFYDEDPVEASKGMRDSDLGHLELIREQLRGKDVKGTSGSVEGSISFFYELLDRAVVTVTDGPPESSNVVGMCFIDPEDRIYNMGDDEPGCPVDVNGYDDDAEEKDERAIPSYQEIYMGNPEKETGTLLSSFFLFHQEHQWLTTPKKDLQPDLWAWDPDAGASNVPVKMMKCKLEIQLLGIRGIPEYHFISSMDKGPSNPYLQFLTDDPTNKKTLPSVKTPSPEFANFMTVVQIDCILPEESHPDFAPRFTVLLRDRGWLDNAAHAITGSEGTVIGYGEILLEQYYPQKMRGSSGELDEKAEVLEESRKDFEKFLRVMVSRGEITASQSANLAAKYKEEMKSKKENAMDPTALMVAFQQFQRGNRPADFSIRVLEFLDANDYAAVSKGVPKSLSIQSAAPVSIQSAAPVPLKSPALVMPPLGDPGIRHVSSDQKSNASRTDQKSNASRTSAAAAAEHKNSTYDVADVIDIPIGHASSGVGVPLPPAASTDLASVLSPDMVVPVQAALSVPREAGDRAAVSGSDADAGHAVSHIAVNVSLDPDVADNVADAEMSRVHAGLKNPTAVNVSEGDKPEAGDDIDADKQPITSEPITAQWMLLRNSLRVDTELEESNLIIPGTKDFSWKDLLGEGFDEISLQRGVKGKSGAIEDAGIVKCRINLFKHLPSGDFKILKPRKGFPTRWKPLDIRSVFPEETVEVRVYVMKCFHMSPDEVDSETGAAGSDCFLRCEIPNHDFQEFTNPDQIQYKTLNPEFNTTVKFQNLRLPGHSFLKISVLGKGSMGPHEIGSTTVDLEDRWFCNAWRELLHKPIEIRTLRKEGSDVSVGKMECMIDILPSAETVQRPALNLSMSSRKQKLNLRVILWNAANVVPLGGYTTDVFVVCQLLGEYGQVEDEQQTDVHPSCKQDELANFNWRMKFKKQEFPNPKKIFMLRLQLWEKNTATANKGICEGLLPIESVFRECAERNLGRASADEMESCFLPGLDAKDVERVADADGGPDFVYPFRWFVPSSISSLA